MKKKIRNLISKGKTKEAIQELIIYSNSTNNKDFQREMILQSVRYEKYNESNRAGITTEEENRVNLIKINDALLTIMDRFLDDSIALGRSNNEFNLKEFFSQNWRRGIIFLVFFIVTIFFISKLTGYNLGNLFLKKRQFDSFSLTVLVHGKNGRDDLILRNQGKVVLDIGSARMDASINEMGEATFKELPSKYEGEKSLISIDHPQPYFPVNRDLEYTLSYGMPIYLAVELKGINLVQGRVFDYREESPLDSVRVSYQNIFTFSDKYGWFELEIPPEKQAKFIRVNFFKEGYKMEEIDSIAPHLKQEIGIMLQKQ